MLLYIIRHADPIYSPDSLTELGCKQAAALAKRLAATGFDKIYSSPNNRAQMTAKPTCELLGLEYGIEDWMSEDLAWRDFSCELEDGSGRHTWTFHRQNTKLKYDETIVSGGKWHESTPFRKINAVDGYNRIAERSDEFTERLGYRREGGAYRIICANDDRVAAFCHQGFGMLWLSHLLDISPHMFLSSFDMTHSGVTILEFKNYEDGQTAPKCLCLSDISHIYQSGLPMKYNNFIDL
ncbi:MAG: histidine phosphatase family protein [Oscillospiraceae bacterium]|nr:histidine phosphatase family protein [Oscillospiraceae bacterium]